MQATHRSGSRFWRSLVQYCSRASRRIHSELPLANHDPGMMMPELGRSMVHEEGLALINEWINSLEGQCL